MCASFTRAHVARARAVNLLVNGETGSHSTTIYKTLAKGDRTEGLLFEERDVVYYYGPIGETAFSSPCSYRLMMSTASSRLAGWTKTFGR